MAANKFCPHCGTALEEGSKFCSGCGSSVATPAVETPVAEEPVAEKTVTETVTIDETPENNVVTPKVAPIVEEVKNNKDKYVGIGVVAVVGILVIIIIVSLFKMLFGGSVEDAVEDILTITYESGDFEDALEYIPDDIIDALKEEGDIDDDEWDEFVEEMNEEIENEREEYEDYKVSWEIKDIDEAKSSEIKDVEEMLKDSFDIKIDIDEMAEVEVEITMVDEDDEEIEEEEVFKMVKIDGDWYNFDLMGSLY